jgi:hypothetical protein
MYTHTQAAMSTDTPQNDDRGPPEWTSSSCQNTREHRPGPQQAPDRQLRSSRFTSKRRAESARPIDSSTRTREQAFCLSLVRLRALLELQQVLDFFDFLLLLSASSTLILLSATLYESLLVAPFT